MINFGLFRFTRSGMEEAFPRASDRVSRVDAILQHAERETYVQHTRTLYQVKF
jgi:hypothetical protein